MVLRSFIIEPVGRMNCGQTDVGRKLKAVHISLLLSVLCSIQLMRLLYVQSLMSSDKHLRSLPCWLAEHFLHNVTRMLHIFKYIF